MTPYYSRWLGYTLEPLPLPEPEEAPEPLAPSPEGAGLDRLSNYLQYLVVLHGPR